MTTLEWLDTHKSEDRYLGSPLLLKRYPREAQHTADAKRLLWNAATEIQIIRG